MPSYGVTDEGFVPKRLDEILEEVHTDLTESFGFDTRLAEGFLNALVTTFCNQIADQWEVAEDVYYSHYVSTAVGTSLDNAMAFGGVKREANMQTCYPLHCTGIDGTTVPADTQVATDTNPQIILYNPKEFIITRESFNKARIRVAVLTGEKVYTIILNGTEYSYSSQSEDTVGDVIFGLKEAIDNPEYEITIDGEILSISDNERARSSTLALSDNLTTEEVTVIANFYTLDYGKITIPDGLITVMVEDVTDFNSVVNVIAPTYGRLAESDIEARTSYRKKGALRSTCMVDSVVAELLEKVENVESAAGFQNDTDITDERGLAPHSVMFIVEGGTNEDIAKAILRKKAGGIQTNGNVLVNAVGMFGDTIPIRFNRPEYLYTWLKVIITGADEKIPVNYKNLVIASIMEDGNGLSAGDFLLTQKFNERIFETVAGVQRIRIYVAYSNIPSYIPEDDEYADEDIETTFGQKVLISEERIEVMKG